MAKIELKFLCATDGKNCTIETKVNDDMISIWLYEQGRINEILLDKSTAIRFAKTLRTEINKIES